jgi:preprotein translocase subunit SecD
MSFSAQKVLNSSLFFWLAVAGLAIYSVMPLRDRLRFGIDLVGGTYITLEVQTAKAIESQLIEALQQIKKQLKDNNIAKPTATEIVPVDKLDDTGKPVAYEMHITFGAIDQAQRASELIVEKNRLFMVQVKGTVVTVRYAKPEEKRIKRDAVERNIEVLRTRVDKLGVAEVPISRQGERNIIVELPDVQDPQRAKAMIGKAAILEFKIVEKMGSEDDILYEYDGVIPGDKEMLPGKAFDGKIFYLVDRYTDITGKLLSDARASFDSGKNQWVVNFQFIPEGGQKFHTLTSKNYHRQLAVVLDGVVITAPRINGAISDNGYIEGEFTPQSAKELALLLKSGSFVAPITFEEERQVGPSLGEASIKSGLLSCLVGLGLILLFSLWYYKLSGLFAFFALVYNMLLILFGLAKLGATLTMPGIAGMVLTIGMAIDASILIYERIKEELAKGDSIEKAVRVGFSNAQWVILDANITTFIVGVVLYQFGTGPIQGFAVTMMLGIISTLITGLFFLKSIFTFVLTHVKLRKLSI